MSQIFSIYVGRYIIYQASIALLIVNAWYSFPFSTRKMYGIKQNKTYLLI
jgi:hypothetical protein